MGYIDDTDLSVSCKVVYEGAYKDAIPPSEIRLQNIDYPEEIIW